MTRNYKGYTIFTIGGGRTERRFAKNREYVAVLGENASNAEKHNATIHAVKLNKIKSKIDLITTA